MADVILSTDNLCKNFGGVQAVHGVSLAVRAGEIHALIGANGAGKTTFLQILCGLRKSDSGTIVFDGGDVTHASAAVRSRAGIAYVAQTPEVFDSLNIAENMWLAGGNDNNLLQTLLPKCDTLQVAGTLDNGHRKLLQLGMALAAQPKLLILDEPTQGLTATEIATTTQLLRDYAETAAVLLVEHNMQVVMEIADTISVLDFGAVLQTGTPTQIRGSAKVREAYLGGVRA